MSLDLISDIRHIMTAKEIEPNVTEQVISELHHLWQGISVYIPVCRSEQSKKMKAEIYEAHQNGANVYELVKKHHVSVAWIYRILKEQKEADLQRQKARDAEANAIPLQPV